MSAHLPFRSPTVVFRQMEDGGVLFCSRTEVYFGLNPVGVTIWEQLPAETQAGGRGFDDLVTALQEAYPGVDRDVLAGDANEFLEAMAASELVKYADGR